MATDNDPLEKWIESTSVKKAKIRGWFSRKCIWGGRRSAPDRFFAKKGVQVFIELKRLLQKPTKLQAREHEEMRAAGCLVFVADSVEACLGILDRLDPDLNGDI